MAAAALHALGRGSEIERRFANPSASAVRRMLERGVRSPTLRTPFRLAGHLGVKPSDILHEVEAKIARARHAAH